MSALANLAALLPDGSSDGNGELAMQADGLPLTEDDLGFASGLRRSLSRGERVLLLRSGDGQTYYALLAME